MKYLLFPILYITWTLDRIFCALLPHTEHPKFKDFFPNWNIVKFAIVRVLILILLVWLAK